MRHERTKMGIKVILKFSNEEFELKGWRGE